MDALDGMVFAEGALLTEGFVQILVLAQLVSLLLVIALLCVAERAYFCGTVRRRRCFRCPLMRREVEVEFRERWLLGFRRSATPDRCSAFEVPTAIECARPCVDSAFRLQWESPLFVSSRLERRL
jgi:hypothetical protein